MNRSVLALALLLLATACATAISPAVCSGRHDVVARAPKNFGQVLAADGKPTAVYRGGELTSCDQIAFLEQLHVTHVLQLNASTSDAARGRHQEGAFEVLPLHLTATTIGRPSTCGEVRTALDYLRDPANWPVYVHCTKGRDRTGYVIGMFERGALSRPVESVMIELAAYGHHGLYRLLFGQIDRELASAEPACLAPLQPKISARGRRQPGTTSSTASTSSTAVTPEGR